MAESDFFAFNLINSAAAVLLLRDFDSLPISFVADEDFVFMRELGKVPEQFTGVIRIPLLMYMDIIRLKMLYLQLMRMSSRSR